MTCVYNKYTKQYSVQCTVNTKLQWLQCASNEVTQVLYNAIDVQFLLELNFILIMPLNDARESWKRQKRLLHLYV